MMWATAISQEQLQQSINKLRKLNQVPELPKENITTPHKNSTHRMSIEREREISSTLAFLSATTDDHLNVMAVCIEEHPNGEGSTIRVASNNGKVSKATEGFKKLANILEQAARRENLKAEAIQQLFQQIIVMDFRRILSRLRSRHATRTKKTVGKPAVITQLNQVLLNKSITPRESLTERDIEVLQERAQKLEVLFERLEGFSNSTANTSEIHKILGEVIKDVYEFNIASDLRTALETFSGNPSLRDHLPEALGKLGRYYAASIELVCAARDRKCRMFRNIKVEAFSIGMPMNRRAPPGKVHAEIQLLFFYELHPGLPYPRFICSSKSACYMCNLFFHLHGGFSIPRTHGRLYEQWLLPDWLDLPVECQRDLGIILARLKEILDDKVEGVSRSKIKYNHPNESVLLPLAHWPSTSALSRNKTSVSASTSTIRPSQYAVQEEKHDGDLQLSIDMPLTPPRTPPVRCHSLHGDKENDMALTPSSLTVTTRHDILDSKSVITVRRSELPYSQSITGTTPSLILQIGKLSLIVEFVHVFSGRLRIELVKDVSVCDGTHEVVDIKEIPTDTELQLSCRNTSNELSFELEIDKKRILHCTFVWNK